MLLSGNQGQSGKQVGQNITAGMGEYSDLLFTELMARYYEQTYRGSKKYLREHPNGTADFSKDVIVAAILQAKVQLHAFRDVSCDG